MDRKLSGNILLNTGFNILSILVPFITAPYLGRTLGAGGIGNYTYVFSVATYFTAFGMLGIQNYGTREIARVRDDREARSRVFWEIFGMQCVTGGAALLCYVLFCLVRHPDTGFFVMAFYVATAVTGTLWYCLGTEHFKSIVIRSGVIKLCSLICIFAFVRGPEDLGIYFLIMALGYFMNAAVLWPAILRDVDFRRPDRRAVLRHFRPNILLFIPAITASVYQTMDKIMIGAMAGEAQLAYYEYADKILNIPNIVFGSIGAVMLSRMSNVLERNEKEYRSLIGYSMDLSMIISAGFAFGAFAVSGEFVRVYYGEAFLQSGMILKILCPAAALYGWNNVLRMQYIIPRDLNAVYIRSTFAGAAVNFICNVIFIPRYAAAGAAVGTIAAQGVIAVFYTAQIHKELPFREYIRRNGFLLICGGLMCAVILLLQRTHGENVRGLILDITAGLIVYTGLCFLFGLTDREHLLHPIVSRITGRKKS